MTTTNLQLVKCGCGGEAVVGEVHFWGRCYTVQCSECGIETKPQNSEAEAIQAWNRAMGNRMELQTVKERTAKVKEGWGLAMCCACEKRVFPCDKYCSHCGCRLIWGDDNE